MISRFLYEIRWWRWFLFGGRWPMQTLYGGAYRLDRESRLVIIARIEKEHADAEPSFLGTYPHRTGEAE